jgi:hypothetical protein
LNLWVIDSPNATPDRIQANGAWQSVRIQFAEFLKYAGVLICPKVDWYWASSQIRQNGSFNEWSQSAGDNQVGVGTINLTVALAPTNVPAFTVASLQTTQALSYATFNVQFTITGTGLDAGGAANAQQLTKAYLYQDNMTDAQDGFRNFIVLNIDPGQTATTITGTLSVPNFAGFGFPPGRYSPTGWKLVVMIGGQSFTLPNAITINE